MRTGGQTAYPAVDPIALSSACIAWDWRLPSVTNNRNSMPMARKSTTSNSKGGRQRTALPSSIRSSASLSTKSTKNESLVPTSSSMRHQSQLRKRKTDDDGYESHSCGDALTNSMGLGPPSRSSKQRRSSPKSIVTTPQVQSEDEDEVSDSVEPLTPSSSTMPDAPTSVVWMDRAANQTNTSNQKAVEAFVTRELFPVLKFVTDRHDELKYDPENETLFVSLF